MEFTKPLYGAAYYDEYMPCDRLVEDMRLMKDAGMDLIRIAESTWSTYEPAEGVYDWTHLDRVLDKAEEYGIHVIVGTPTYAVPAWLVAKYPDILSDTHTGRERYGRRQNMDFTNPDYLVHAENIIRRLMERCAKRSCVIGFQIDNETAAYDNCGVTIQQRFVATLKEKYPNISDFNREFGLDYWSNRVDCWEDFPDVRGTINQSLDATFKKFQRSLVTQFHNWQIAIVKEYMREDQFITHNFDYGWNGFSHGIKYDVDQYDCAQNMDIAGTDIYHPSGAALTGAEIAFGGALARSLKRDNYLVLETQAQGNLGWYPYPGQLRLQAFSHIAQGANAVEYWHWHSIHNAIESYWKGVLSHNLKPNATYRECQTIGKDLQRFGSSLVNLKKENRIAVMVSTSSMVALDEFKIHDDLRYNDILCWITDALYRCNLEYDLVSDSFTLSELAGYDLLIVPALYSASTVLIDILKAYCAQGGHLFMTFKSCFANENLKIYATDAPNGLTEVFGMTYDAFTSDTPALYFSGLEAPATVSVSYFMELLIPASNTHVLATYAHPAYKDYAAITEHAYGQGKATYLGCYFAGETLERVLMHAALQAGIAAPRYHFPIVTCQGINEEGHRIEYLMNYSEEELEVAPSIEGKELLSDSHLQANESITLQPWGFIIMEECL